MRKYLFVLLIGVLGVACGAKLSDSEKADVHLQRAVRLVAENRLNSAKIELDSIHELYPRLVEKRREAKSLSDSIIYIESQRTLQFCDSVLLVKLAEQTTLQKEFRFEKDEKYQEQGQYVHRLLRTENNAQRTFLQAYVTEGAETIVKSTYCGRSKIEHTHFRMYAGDFEFAATEIPPSDAANHTFTDDGTTWEMLTWRGEGAMNILNFISSNESERIKLDLLGGKRNHIYYLNRNEKRALAATYHLGVVMADVKALQTEVRRATLRIEKFESRK